MAGKIEKFEDLAVFQHARGLTSDVYRLTRQPKATRDYALVDQIRRAAISILSNIAEGYERGSNPELVQFLYIAKGSCGELRAQLMVAHDQEYLGSVEYEELKGNARQISAMLANWIRYLQQSKYRGRKQQLRESGNDSNS